MCWKIHKMKVRSVPLFLRDKVHNFSQVSLQFETFKCSEG